MHFITEDIIKLVISAGTGAIIGLEREYHSKSAGLRTMILICLGSTLFTIISMKLGSDPSRIAANIVTGIGFVGGGIIFRDNSNGQITGITTAAAAWVTSALGMCVGFGDGLYETGFVSMIFVVCALYLLVPFQQVIKHKNSIRTYRIVCKFKSKSLKHYEDKFEQFGLTAERGKQSKNDETISGVWIVKGPEKNHEKAIKHLMNDPEIVEFDF
ncbi:MgtC/SapB transporter [Emticicia oligotrophica DSM 17448]|uniref:MgtC/SapB transporter n=1 Tax=Emticicia oligotrophica (strain DSM 17448 / CIP 109782 / MTCC 6937 / GPTSA100-15) TaxID=929562 RepID=A0ABM5MXT5_EMTOG|nr:MgtC/SapB family protein [Emticicia oligotrophica]AFK01987.1 MgtC/SapB transporter [Emticicia oligotrophica DSM 17448]